jgi:adenine phosphoribosyltransferase
MMAGYKLLQRLGADVVEAAGIIELPELGGGDLMRGLDIPLFTVCSFDGH